MSSISMGKVLLDLVFAYIVFSLFRLLVCAEEQQGSYENDIGLLLPSCLQVLNSESNNSYYHLLGYLSILSFVLFFGHERKPSLDAFHHEKKEIARQSVTAGLNFT